MILVCWLEEFIIYYFNFSLTSSSKSFCICCFNSSEIGGGLNIDGDDSASASIILLTSSLMNWSKSSSSQCFAMSLPT